MPTEPTERPAEKRRALRYKPGVALRAACEWADAEPASIEGAITDFSVAGIALQYAQGSEPPRIGTTGRVSLRLGQESHSFDVTLARLVRWAGGSWLAGLAFPKRRECRVRARRVIDHLKAAYRAGAVQRIEADAGAVARIVGTLNFHVVISLHRLLRGPEPPAEIDLQACTGIDQSGAQFLVTAREHGVRLRLDPEGRLAELIERHAASRPAGLSASASGNDAFALQA